MATGSPKHLRDTVSQIGTVHEPVLEPKAIARSCSDKARTQTQGTKSHEHLKSKYRNDK